MDSEVSNTSSVDTKTSSTISANFKKTMNEISATTSDLINTNHLQNGLQHTLKNISEAFTPSLTTLPDEQLSGHVQDQAHVSDLATKNLMRLITHSARLSTRPQTSHQNQQVQHHHCRVRRNERRRDLSKSLASRRPNVPLTTATRLLCVGISWRIDPTLFLTSSVEDPSKNTGSGKGGAFESRQIFDRVGDP